MIKKSQIRRNLRLLFLLSTSNKKLKSFLTLRFGGSQKLFWLEKSNDEFAKPHKLIFSELRFPR